MTEFRFKGYSEQYLMEYEIVGFWDFDVNMGSIHIYDEITRITKKHFYDFVEFSKYFAELKEKLTKNPDKFGDSVFEYERLMKKATYELFFKKEV